MPIRARLVSYDHDEGRLYVEAIGTDVNTTSITGLRGTGEAWVDPADLKAFAEQLAIYPLAGRVELSCPLGDEEVLGVTVVQLDRVGHLGIQVRMRSQSWNDAHLETQQSAAVFVATTYEALGRFARTLRRLCETPGDGVAELD